MTTATTLPTCTWTVNLLGSPEDYRSGEVTGLSVTSSDWTDDGATRWPSDYEVAAEASRQVGARVELHFADCGDHPTLTESIYTIDRVG